MAKSKKPRKRYVPKLLGTPVTWGVGEADNRRMKLIPHQELSKLREGVGDEVSWNTIVCRLNVGGVLSVAHKFSEDPAPTVRAALNAMVALRKRIDETGKYLLTGDEYRAVGEGLVLLDDLQDTITRREHRDALRAVMATSMV